MGCGVGCSTELLKELGFEVIGIDILENMVGICKEKGLDYKKVAEEWAVY